MSEKIDLLSRSQEELETWLLSLGEKKFRGKQIYEWLHVRHVRDIDQMTNLSKSLRDRLREEAFLTCPHALQVLTSQLDGTKKYLFALPDGNVIESVLMKYSYGYSVCISSQVGCRMGCRFCASTIGGRIRDLTASEMLGQVLEISRLQGERISHVVIMGSGEPLDNYDNLVRFLRIMGDPDGERLSLRDITVSTCGIVPNLYRLADEGLPITLAISLHASNQQEREDLLPIAKKYGMDELMTAVRAYFAKTGRRVTFEYSCVQGVNTSPKDARRLAGLLRGLNCHVNLIPVNPVRERDFTQPSGRDLAAFRRMLEKYGIHVTIRRELGRDISASCGQLRRSYLEENGNLLSDGCRSQTE